MLTLAELKHFMPVPVLEQNYPTAKYLKTHGTVLVSKSIATDVKSPFIKMGMPFMKYLVLQRYFPFGIVRTIAMRWNKMKSQSNGLKKRLGISV